MKVFALLALLGVALAKPHQHSHHQNNGNHHGHGHGHQGSTDIGSITTYAGSCGTSTRTLDSIANYIVGGTVAGVGDYPWQIALKSNGGFICGGSYVRASDGTAYVITAAHCVESKRSRYEVVFGMHRRSEENFAYTVRATATPHPNYDNRILSNDIAVLTLTSLDELALAKTNAEPICLASRPYQGGETATVSGWGTTSESGSISDVLLYVDKPVIDYTKCNTEGANAGQLDASMMCAGVEGKDACQGDSGGPLAISRGGVWELAGVVSWGYGCARPNSPGVYADVHNLQDFLKVFKLY